MGTLASFKKDVVERKVTKLEVMEWFGKVGNDIPERLRGVREIIRVTSYGILIKTNDGKESSLALRGRLTSYDEEYLIAYAPEYRELTADEKKVLDEVNRLQSTGDKVKAIEFAESVGMGYLIGRKFEHGMMYDWSTGKVIDRNKKGDIQLIYRVANTKGCEI